MRRFVLIALGLVLVTSVTVAACAGPGAAVQREGSAVVTVPLSWSNAYLVLGDRPLLVDPGSDSQADADRIEAALSARGLALSDLSLIVLTHGHADHAGGTARIAKASGAPILAGAADSTMLARGESGPLTTMGLEATLIRPFVPSTYRPVAADSTLGAQSGHTSLDLRPFGVDAVALHMPGHTAGSLVVMLASGEAIVGDLFRGGLFGGQLDPETPHRHYFHDDADRAEAAIRGLLDRGTTRFYLGHGGPVSADAARRRFGR